MTLIEAQTVYPAIATPMDLLEMMKLIHHSSEDFDTGDINHRIWKFTQYVLQQLAVATLNSPWHLHDDLTTGYAARLRQGETPPPIIYDAAAHEMIDGGHRLAAAQQAGLTMLSAYVGLPANIDPDWDEETDAG